MTKTQALIAGIRAGYFGPAVEQPSRAAKKTMFCVERFGTWSNCYIWVGISGSVRVADRPAFTASIPLTDATKARIEDLGRKQQ